MVSNPHVGSGSTEEIILVNSSWLVKLQNCFILPVLEYWLSSGEVFQDLEVPIRPMGYIDYQIDW